LIQLEIAKATYSEFTNQEKREWGGANDHEEVYLQLKEQKWGKKI